MNDPKSQPMFERCRDLEDKPDGPDRLSAIEASEIACKSARCALATGSLPVPSGLFFALASEWQRRIDDTQRVINNPEAQHRAGALEINRLRTVNEVRRELLKELRAELAHATERQPEENRWRCGAARRRCHAEGKDSMKPTNENTTAAQAVATGDLFGRLEALRLRLCKVGLHPKYHDTPEKAADAVCEMIEYFRRELANPPADVCGLVMRKYGVEGFMEDGEQPRCRLVFLPNDKDEPRGGL